MTILESNVLDNEEKQLALESSRFLANYSSQADIVEIGLDGESISVPASALKLLQKILAEMAEGNAISLVPANTELTSQQAANLINVSRPHLVSLLDSGKIPHHKVGSHRRVMLDDLMAYKKASLIKQYKALKDLGEQAQELGMGY